MATVFAHLASRLALVAPPDATCGTNLNPDCGLHSVLHWLWFAVAAMAVLFVVVLVMVIRYFRNARRADPNKKDTEE